MQVGIRVCTYDYPFTSWLKYTINSNKKLAPKRPGRLIRIPAPSLDEDIPIKIKLKVPMDLRQLASDGVPVHQIWMKMDIMQIGELPVQLQQHGRILHKLIRESLKGLILQGHSDGHLLVAWIPVSPGLIQRRHVILQTHREAY